MQGKKLRQLVESGLILPQYVNLTGILIVLFLSFSIQAFSAQKETALNYKSEVVMDSYGKLVVHDIWRRDCSTYSPTELGFKPRLFGEKNTEGEKLKILALRKNGAMRPCMKFYRGDSVEYMLIDPSFYSIESIPEEEMSSEEKTKYLASMKEVCAASGINTYEQLTEPLQRASRSNKEYGMHEVEWWLHAKEFNIDNAELSYFLPKGIRVYDWESVVKDKNGNKLRKEVSVIFEDNRSKITFRVLGGLRKGEKLHAAIWFPSTNLKTESYLYKVAQKIIVKFKDPFFLSSLYTWVSLIFILCVVAFVSSRDRWF